MPVYNTEKYLSRALESLINQTLKEIEIICINDESTDNSLKVLEEYARKDNRIIILNQKRGGAASARNAGLEIARGKYIGFVDSDDWVNPETYETAVSKMADDIDMVLFNANMFVENPGETNLNVIENFQQYPQHNLTGEVELSDKMIIDLPVTLWNKLFKSSNIKKYGIRFPGFFHLFEDNSFFYQYAIISKKVYFIDKPLYNYLYLRENSIMYKTYNKAHDRITDRINVAYNLYNFLKSRNILEEKAKLFIFIFALAIYMDYKFCQTEYKIEVLEEASNVAKKMDISENVYLEKQPTLNNLIQTLKINGNPIPCLLGVFPDLLD
jgi:Glycosyltransferases involved in cell wall biogenesis